MVHSDPPISSGPASAEELLGAARKLVSDLMRSKALVHGDVAGAFEQLTETAANALHVERVSVWTFDQNDDLVCKNLFELRLARHSSGQTIHAKDAPAYFAALDTERTVAAHDARTDPRTREFIERVARSMHHPDSRRLIRAWHGTCRDDRRNQQHPARAPVRKAVLDAHDIRIGRGGRRANESLPCRERQLVEMDRDHALS